jgi:hypothetical protein
MNKLVNGEIVAMTQEEIDALELSRIVAPIVPQVVTMRQARLALLQTGKLATVNAAIAGMAGTQGDAARIEWEFSSEVKRSQPLVMALAPALSMTSADLDALFILAAGL